MIYWALLTTTLCVTKHTLQAGLKNNFERLTRIPLYSMHPSCNIFDYLMLFFFSKATAQSLTLVTTMFNSSQNSCPFQTNESNCPILLPTFMSAIKEKSLQCNLQTSYLKITLCTLFVKWKQVSCLLQSTS